MSDKLVFKPRARLILQLGDQLIKNESIALLELVKNSYDALATQVEINMHKLEEPEKGFISIMDNGSGMDGDIIRNIWLEPGSDYKAKLLEEIFKSGKKVKRKPLGEKGIGRFSAHKLGETVELVSRMQGKKEVYVKIDWTDFDKGGYIDEVPIKMINREPEVFKGKNTGTQIKITHLRPDQWPEKILKEVYRSVNAIVSPFETVDSFNIDFKVDDPNIFKGIPTIKEIREMALYSFYCEMEGDSITRFSYNFLPYSSMTKLSPRSLNYNMDENKKNNYPDFEKIKLMTSKAERNLETGKRESPVIDLSIKGMKVGKVKFEGLIFDRQSKVLKLSHSEPKASKEYLNQNGGIRIYRDGIRVYDYGEPENDWLDLEQSRLYDPGVKLNRTLVLAAVHLDRESSRDLVEKTNREGFVDNEAYKMLRKAVLYAIKIVETCRNYDKELVRDNYGASPKSEPVLDTVSDLKEFVVDNIKDEEVRKECIGYLDKIEREYREINEVLMVSAEAGLNLSVAIHEIEKIVSELKKVVLSEKSPGRIVKLIDNLSELIEMYATLIRRSRKKTEDLKQLIEDSLFHVQYRLRAHKVMMVKEYLDFKGETNIKCSRRLVIGSILNLIDNSIYWLEREKIEDKKIYISLKKAEKGYIELLVADNGLGFALPPEQMIKPFIGLKQGGMGLGLHIANEVLCAQGGKIDFPKFSKTDLPKDFKNGAIVSLVFKKESEE